MIAHHGKQEYRNEYPSDAGRHFGGRKVAVLRNCPGSRIRSMFKRSYKGAYHKMSPKHLQRHVNEFSGRHNVREGDTNLQTELTVERMKDRQLTYWQRKANNELDSGA